MMITKWLAPVAVLLASLWPSSYAQACSCDGAGGTREKLQGGDAAFIGRLLRVEPLPREHAPEGVLDYGLLYTFRVEESFTRRLPPELKVASPDHPGMCAIGALEGELSAFVVYEYEAGRYVSTSCASVDPVDLRAEARPLPPPDSTGPPAFILGGAFGEVRTIALDASGRTLAYGSGEGKVEELKMCPGGVRLVERVFSEDGVATLAIRDLPSLRTVNEFRIPRVQNLDSVSFACLDDQGHVILFSTDLPYGKQGSFLWHWDGTRWRRIALGRDVASAEFIGTTAYLTTVEPTPQLVSYDLLTGRRRVLAPVPPQSGDWIVSPDGKRIAGVTVQSPRERLPRLVVVGLSDAPIGISRPLGAGAKYATIEWAGNHRVAVLPRLGEPRVRIFDVFSRQLTVWDEPWNAFLKSVVGERVYGILERSRRLASVRLSDGRGQQVIGRRGLETGMATILFPDAIRGARSLPGPSASILEHATPEGRSIPTSAAVRDEKETLTKGNLKSERILISLLAITLLLVTVRFATRNRIRRAGASRQRGQGPRAPSNS